jgi:hypothetical protein
MRIAIAFLLLVSCAAQPANRNDSAVVDELRAAGLTLADRGPVEQPFLSLGGRVYEVEGGELQVYVYSSESAAQADAAKISPDGKVEAMQISWMAQPHFYRRGSTLAIYVGSNALALDALQQVLGAPFAEHP